MKCNGIAWFDCKAVRDSRLQTLTGRYSGEHDQRRSRATILLI